MIPRGIIHPDALAELREIFRPFFDELHAIVDELNRDADVAADEPAEPHE